MLDKHSGVYICVPWPACPVKHILSSDFLEKTGQGIEEL